MQAGAAAAAPGRVLTLSPKPQLARLVHDGGRFIRMIRQSAQFYRDAVGNPNTTPSEPAERQEARALIAE
jgi:hypothetical protein